MSLKLSLVLAGNLKVRKPRMRCFFLSNSTQIETLHTRFLE